MSVINMRLLLPLTLVLSLIGSLQGCGKINLYNNEVLRAFDGEAARLYSKLPLTVERDVPLSEKCPSDVHSGQTMKARITFSGGAIRRDGSCTMVNNKTCEAACKILLNDINAEIKFVVSGKQVSAATVQLNYNAVLRAAIYTYRENWGPTAEFLDPWIQNAPNDGPIIILMPNNKQATLCIDYFRQEFNKLISNQKNLTAILNATVEASGVQAINNGCINAIPTAVKTAECLDAVTSGVYSTCIKEQLKNSRQAPLTWHQIFDRKCRRKLDLNILDDCNKKHLIIKTPSGKYVPWYKVWRCIESPGHLLG